MNKKIVSILTVLALLLTIIPINAVRAASKDFTVTITPDKTQINGGESGEVTYTVSLESKIPTTAIQLHFQIPEGMEYVSGQMNESARAKFSENLPAGDGRLDQFYIGSVASGGVKENGILITDESGMNISGKADIATFKCQIKDTSKPGEYEVGLSKYRISNMDIEQITEDQKALNVAKTKVVISAKGISLNKKQTTIQAGKTEKLDATLTPANASDKIIWETSNSEIADVDQTGLVTAIKAGGPVTITARTENGNYSDSCAVTVECAHEHTTHHPATESTCKDHGYTEYTDCDACGEIISGEKTQKPLADHTFGEIVPKKEAVHGGENGMEAHYVCEVCGKLFKEDKKTETNEDELKIEDPHVYGDDWKHNTEDHWKECGCGNKINEEQHSGGKASCTKPAVCEVCGAEYGEVDPENHVNKKVKNVVSATCTEEGYTGDTYCEDCGAELAKGTKTAPLGHKGGEASCTKPAVCEVCGEEYGEIDPKNHVNTEVRGYVEATTEKEGYTGDIYCLDCEELVKQGEIIPVLPVEEEEQEQEPQVSEEDTPTTISKDEKSNGPSTNDISNMTLWMSLLVISGFSFVGIMIWNLKNKLRKNTK